MILFSLKPSIIQLRKEQIKIADSKKNEITKETWKKLNLKLENDLMNPPFTPSTTELGEKMFQILFKLVHSKYYPLVKQNKGYLSKIMSYDTDDIFTTLYEDLNDFLTIPIKQEPHSPA